MNQDITSEKMIADAMKYGTGVIGHKHTDVFRYSEALNPYSWSIRYFDDWRCVADYLRREKI